MSRMMYYPAVVLGAYRNPQEAVASLHIEGSVGEVLLEALISAPDGDVTVYAEMAEALESGGKRDAIAFRRADDGTVRVYFGLPYAQFKSRRAAIAFAQAAVNGGAFRISGERTAALHALPWTGITPLSFTPDGSSSAASQ